MQHYYLCLSTKGIVMDNKFKDLFTALCYDEPHDCFVIPALATEKMKAEISYEEFVTRLQEMWEYCEEVRKYFRALNWENNLKVVTEMVQATFFDGNGYAVPCFGVYINEKPEQQMVNSWIRVPSMVAGRSSFLPTTDFAKDTVMAKFAKDLYLNLNQWEQWLKKKRSEMGNQIPEFTEQINEDGFGKKELARPYQKKIDELLKKTQK